MDVPLEMRGAGRDGVVLVHDIMGLDAVNLECAERLAKEGFRVAAVDAFRGARPASIPEGLKLRQALTKDDILAVMRAGHDALRRELGAEARIACMGFCMGGGMALQGACALPFAACVDWYGMIPEAHDAQGLQGPVLLILASEDDRINPWAYGQLLPALDQHRKRAEVQLYPATHHPFHRRDWEHYDARAAHDAWARAVRFLREA